MNIFIFAYVFLHQCHNLKCFMFQSALKTLWSGPSLKDILMRIDQLDSNYIPTDKMIDVRYTIDIFQHIDQSIGFLSNLNWHERRRCSRSAFRRLTGNDVSGPLFSSLFFHFFFSFFFSFFIFFFFSVAYFSHRSALRMKKCLQRKLFGAGQNLGINSFPPY